MSKIYKRAAARRDLVGHYVHLAEAGGLELADRFLRETEATFFELSMQREMGSPLTLRRPEFAGMRKWRVKTFENYLIFYLPRHDGVSIVRVLYAAQDWWNLLGMGTGGNLG
jgi:toxin ParE1/3/4